MKIILSVLAVTHNKQILIFFCFLKLFSNPFYTFWCWSEICVHIFIKVKFCFIFNQFLLKIFLYFYCNCEGGTKARIVKTCRTMYPTSIVRLTHNDCECHPLYFIYVIYYMLTSSYSHNNRIKIAKLVNMNIVTYIKERKVHHCRIFIRKQTEITDQLW